MAVETVKKATRFRIKHPLTGSAVVEASDPAAAKERFLREKFPGEAGNENWLKQAMDLPIRVNRLPEPQKSETDGGPLVGREADATARALRDKIKEKGLAAIT